MTTQALLDDRYGRTRSLRARVISWSVIGALAAAVFGLVAWSTWSGAADAVDADVTTFTVDDTHSITVALQFTAPIGASVACALEAQDPEHGVVGWRVVEYPASASHAQAFIETIPTVAEATTGFVNSCWVF